MWTTHRPETDLKALQGRVEQLESEKREREEVEFHKVERERRQRVQDAKDALRTARTWPDAFRKQQLLLGPEIKAQAKALAETKALLADHPDDEDSVRYLAYVTEDLAGLRDDVAACDTAARVLAEEDEKVREDVERIRRRARENAARRVLEAHPTSSIAKELAERLPADDMEGWLDW